LFLQKAIYPHVRLGQGGDPRNEFRQRHRQGRAEFGVGVKYRQLWKMDWRCLSSWADVVADVPVIRDEDVSARDISERAAGGKIGERTPQASCE
jgi:hypothetical protein